MHSVDVLIGTNNPGKFTDARFVRDSFFPRIVLHSPTDIGITGNPRENGNTYTENAHIKRDFYLAELHRLGLENYFVISEDSGIEIDALGGEPGIHSRRWKDGTTAMTDQEIIDYTLERLQGVAAAKRTAAFAGVVALGQASSALNLDVPYRLEGILLEAPSPAGWHEGFPFRSLFYLPEYRMLLHEISSLPKGERPKDFMSHREIGMRAAFNKIMELAGSL